MKIRLRFHVVIALLFCPHASAETTGTDLVTQARQWRQSFGLAGARDKLLAAVARGDSSNGAFEQRVWATNGDKARMWPDAVARSSPAEKARTGIFIVLGYRQHSGRSQRIVRHAARRLQETGWHAQLIDVPEWSASAADDVAAIDRVVARELPAVDRAILVGFSKGGWDWINWFHGPAANLPAEQRAKIRLLVNFAAILRGSAIAGWAANDHGMDATFFRSIMLVRFGSRGATPRYLRSLAEDPFGSTASRESRPLLRSIAPELRTIEYVALPEGADGLPHGNGFFHWVSHRATERQRWMGPCDGMAESAAQLLPRWEGIPAWVVRVKGSHALLDGRYLDGGIVSARYQARGADQWKGGEQLMDDFLRALPRSAVGW